MIMNEHVHFTKNWRKFLIIIATANDRPDFFWEIGFKEEDIYHDDHFVN